MDAYRRLSDGTQILWEYIGSAYATPAAAQSAFNGLASYYPTLAQYYPGATAGACTFPGADQCYQALAPVLNDPAGNPQEVVIRVLRDANTVFEAAYIVGEADYATNKAAGDQALDTLASDYVGLFSSKTTPSPTLPTPTTTPGPTSTPTRVTFSMARVWWEKASTKGHSDDPGITTGQPGSLVYFAVAYRVLSAPPSLPVTVTFRVPWNKGANVKQGLLQATDQTGTYITRAEFRLPSRPGAYKGSVSVQMGGKTGRGTAAITVPVILPPSFSFDALQSLNASNQQQTSFHRNERSYVKVAWTVRDLHGSTTYKIERSYYTPSARPEDRGWRLLNTTDDTGIAYNGQGFRTFVVIAPRIAAAYRIVVRIFMLSHWSQARTIVIHYG
ncbi:MAG: hypothetical protein JOZ41_22140, partial [Chloroflexi bacterium]|nr:hypothetical protein [Chloroflexota bacterium]